MDLYIKSQNELYGRSVYFTDKGFITYKVIGDVLYIHLIYVDKDYRRLKVGENLLLTLIKSTGAKTLLGYVDKEAKNWEESLKVHLTYGASILKETETQISVYKDL